MFARASDIPEFVNDGVADMGITGVDLIQENEADVEELLDLRFGQTKLVIAAPEESGINSLDDIAQDMKVATEFPVLTKKYLEEKGYTQIKMQILTGIDQSDYSKLESGKRFFQQFRAGTAGTDPKPHRPGI